MAANICMLLTASLAGTAVAVRTVDRHLAVDCTYT